MEIKFKQSRNWWQKEDLNWFIENAEFAFTNNGYRGNRIRIVTKIPLYSIEDSDIKMNCFEFDNDRHGIIITSETMLSKGLEEMIVQRSNDVVDLFIEFLDKSGAGEFVNPKFSINDFFNRKDKIIKIKRIYPF